MNTNLKLQPTDDEWMLATSALAARITVTVKKRVQERAHLGFSQRAYERNDWSPTSVKVDWILVFWLDNAVQLTEHSLFGYSTQQFNHGYTTKKAAVAESDAALAFVREWFTGSSWWNLNNRQIAAIMNGIDIGDEHK